MLFRSAKLESATSTGVLSKPSLCLFSALSLGIDMTLVRSRREPDSFGRVTCSLLKKVNEFVGEKLLRHCEAGFCAVDDLDPRLESVLLLFLLREEGLGTEAVAEASAAALLLLLPLPLPHFSPSLSAPFFLNRKPNIVTGEMKW